MKERNAPEQIVRKLRQAEAELAAGVYPRGRHKGGDLSPQKSAWLEKGRCDGVPQETGGREPNRG